MILPRSQDAIHRFQLYRCLIAILDDSVISQSVVFKGGTCAAMLGYLDRFSLDLDFDLKEKEDKNKLEKRLKVIFTEADFEIKEKSKNGLFYVLKYDSKKGIRNTIKLGITPIMTKFDRYDIFYLAEIDRYANCQKIETMFAHKLVSLTDRFRKYKMIAGRDLYDIHHFFLSGYRYSKDIIEARTGGKLGEYLGELISFIDTKITDRVLSEDLNYLLLPEKFEKVRKILKKETLLFLNNEIDRMK